VCSLVTHLKVRTIKGVFCPPYGVLCSPRDKYKFALYEGRVIIKSTLPLFVGE